MNDHYRDQDVHFEPDEQQALDALLTPPRLQEAEWEQLRSRIRSACELPLAQRRNAIQPQRARTKHWLRAALLPLAAAATLLLVLRPSSDTDDERSARAELTAVEQVLLADIPDAQFTQLVAGGADAEQLLLMAVDEE